MKNRHEHAVRRRSFSIQAILIVDDLPANRTYLATLLRHHGYRLLEASDGDEALAIVRADRPDLVITDVLMPVMDGFEFLRQLRGDPAVSETPVVFYTAHYGEREARALALSLGVHEVLTKPVGSADVLSVVRRVLSGSRDTDRPAPSAKPPLEFDREHLQRLTDKVLEKADTLRTANARLRGLINIGLEFASEGGTPHPPRRRWLSRSSSRWRSSRSTSCSRTWTAGGS